MNNSKFEHSIQNSNGIQNTLGTRRHFDIASVADVPIYLLLKM